MRRARASSTMRAVAVSRRLLLQAARSSCRRTADRRGLGIGKGMVIPRCAMRDSCWGASRHAPLPLGGATGCTHLVSSSYPRRSPARLRPSPRPFRHSGRAFRFAPARKNPKKRTGEVRPAPRARNQAREPRRRRHACPPARGTRGKGFRPAGASAAGRAERSGTKRDGGTACGTGANEASAGRAEAAQRAGT